LYITVQCYVKSGRKYRHYSRLQDPVTPWQLLASSRITGATGLAGRTGIDRDSLAPLVLPDSLAPLVLPDSLAPLFYRTHWPRCVLPDSLARWFCRRSWFYRSRWLYRSAVLPEPLVLPDCRVTKAIQEPPVSHGKAIGMFPQLL